MSHFSLITTTGLAPAQDRVVPAPSAALGPQLRGEDGGTLQKPSKEVGESGRDTWSRGA